MTRNSVTDDTSGNTSVESLLRPARETPGVGAGRPSSPVRDSESVEPRGTIGCVVVRVVRTQTSGEECLKL